MSNFMLLSAEASLWELMTKLRWRLHDYCLVVTNFQVWAIKQAQLDTLSQAMAWGDAEKPQWDMAFLLIMLSITPEHKRIFSLINAWAHPCQACYTTLADAVCRLVLLMDGSANWVYAFVQLNEVLSYAPLSSVGHISAMTDGTQSADPHGQLHQLQVHKLLQCKDMVGCPKSLNGQMEALQFTTKELPLLDAATPGEPTHKLQLMIVDLGSMQAEGITTNTQTLTSTDILPPPGDTAEPSDDITAAINLPLMGTME